MVISGPSSLIDSLAIPTFAAALLMLLTDRLGASGFFNPALGGDPIAYAHLFWFTFHPEVYVLVIPAIGMMYEIIPRFHANRYTVRVLESLRSYYSQLWRFHHGHITCMRQECHLQKKYFSFMVGTLAAV